jgi:hypothetical protein
VNKGNKGIRGTRGRRGIRGRLCIYDVLCLVYVIECLRRSNDTSYVHIIIIIGMNVVVNLNSV